MQNENNLIIENQTRQIDDDASNMPNGVDMFVTPMPVPYVPEYVTKKQKADILDYICVILKISPLEKAEYMARNMYACRDIAERFIDFIYTERYDNELVIEEYTALSIKEKAQDKLNDFEIYNTLCNLRFDRERTKMFIKMNFPGYRKGVFYEDIERVDIEKYQAWKDKKKKKKIDSEPKTEKTNERKADSLVEQE